MISIRFNRITIGAGSLILPMFILASLAPPPDASSPGAAARNRYIGAKACKNCHKSEAKGHQFVKWSEGKHAKAFELLGTPAAKESGAKLGVTDPQTDDKCLQCHVTAHGLGRKQIKRGFDPKMGVQCESCHGPGEQHAKARFKAASSGDADPNAYVVVPEDEIVRQPPVATCLECHNKENPNYKPFCFKERREIISHWNPQKPRTAEEIEALECTCGDCKCEQAECGSYLKAKK